MASTDTTDVSLPKCLIHLHSVTTENPQLLSEVRWSKIVECSKKWIDFRGSDKLLAEKLDSLGHLDVSFADARQKQPDMGFHPTCYRRYIDSKRLRAAEKRFQEESAPLAEAHSPPKRPRLRAASSSCGSLLAAGPVLPAKCIICKKSELLISVQGKRIRDKLRKAETNDGGMLRRAAQAKKDEDVLIHIRDKDCVSLEVRYHASCYKNYTRFLTRKRKNLEQSCNIVLDSTIDQHQDGYQIFCETVIHQRIVANEEALRLSKLTQLLTRVVSTQEGLELPCIRADTLKRRLEKDFPQLVFHRPCRQNESTIVYYSEVSAGSFIDRFAFSEESSSSEASETESEIPSQQSSSTCPDNDLARTMYMAGLIVKNAIKASPGLTGPWPPRADDLTMECVEKSVPRELFNLLAWCTGAAEDPSLIDYATVDDEVKGKLMSICQDIMYLTSRGKKQMPKSLCLALTVRHVTGSSHLLKLLHNLGHCSSLDTVMSFETGLALLRLETTNDIPPGFAPGNLTSVVWDNIDFGEETVSGHGTTHHTNGIMIQKEIAEQEFQNRPCVKKGVRSLKPQITALEDYRRSKRQGPKCEVDASILGRQHYEPLIMPALKKDLAYIIAKLNDDGHEVPGWTGFNINLLGEMELQKSAIHYLPVIEASPTEMSTINTIIRRSVELADRLQLEHIVLVFDQAIYAKVQEIRWGDEQLKKRLVVRLGEFHTCMSFMSVLGKRFGDAGLSDILIESGVVAVGSVNGVLSGHHYNRSVYAHKVLFEALQRIRFGMFIEALSKEDLEKYEDVLHMKNVSMENLEKSTELDDLLVEYGDYVKKRSTEDPTFALWSSYLEMVSLLLTFIRATRESNWELHVAVLRLMMPWYFAYDRTNYARYLPAYWLEMVNLSSSHSSCFKAMTRCGGWTVQRQGRYPFASIACDQAIEETVNRDSKTRGGIRGITLKRAAVQRWILAQPERAAISRQCERLAGYGTINRSPKELDSTRTRRLENSVLSVMSTVSSMINPFDSVSERLVCLSSGAVATSDVQEDLLNASSCGEAATVEFLKTRLINNSKDLFDPIKQKKLKTFKDNVKSQKRMGKEVIRNSKAFFARLLVTGQKRKIDLREVLQYSLGNVSFPLANANGSLAKTDKSALMRVLEDKCDNIYVTDIPDGAAVMVDAMAHLQSMKDIPETFGDLSDAVLKQVLGIATSNKCSRVDFVCDTYPSTSIKDIERSRRAGKGSQAIKIYSKEQKTPRQWKKFLADGTNKEALAEFLYETWKGTNYRSNLVMMMAHGPNCHQLKWSDAICEASECLELRCDHEEADTRLLLHAKHASESHTSIIIRSPDTDVAIIALTLLGDINNQVFFMTGKKNRSRVIDLTRMYSELDPSICKCLIGLHVFTGCDSTSAFYGKGKRRAFQVLKDYPEFQSTFTKLGQEFQLDDNAISALGKFVGLLYGQKSTSINDARYKAFCSTLSERSLPPCHNALTQHCKRSNYQAAVHKRSLQQQILAPTPSGYGWKIQKNEVSIVWITQSPAPKSLLQCTSCSCKVGKCLKGRCSCLGADLPCTDLCKCLDCENSKTAEDEIDFECDTDEEDSMEEDV